MCLLGLEILPLCCHYVGMTPKKDTVKRAADLVRSRREKLGLSQQILLERGGPSRSVVTKLELENVWPARPATQIKLARSLGWREDAFDLIEAGHDPVVIGGDVNKDELRSLIGAARQILEELERRLGS